MNYGLALVTGANSGIGKETVIGLLKAGYKVILACRNVQAASAVKEELDKDFSNELSEVRELDLSSLSSVKKFSDDFCKSNESLEILVNNAGVLMNDYKKSQNNLELTFATNHLGHFYLTMLLLDKLKNAKESRVINVASLAHKNGIAPLSKILNEADLCLQGESARDHFNQKLENDFGMWRNYSMSKYANILFTCRLKKYLKMQGINNVLTFSLHPGVIKSNLFNSLENRFWFSIIKPIASLFLSNTTDGAKTSLHCCLAKDLEKVDGWYFDKSSPSQNFSEEKATRKLAKKLWILSEKLVLEY